MKDYNSSYHTERTHLKIVFFIQLAKNVRVEGFLLTSNTTNVIFMLQIDTPDCDKCTNGKLKLTAELNNVTNEKNAVDFTSEELHMDKITVVSLKSAAQYLIELFNQTGQIYSCTRTKIGKLLSIAAFKYARLGHQLFNEGIYKYKDCGSVVEDLVAYIGMEPYVNYQYQDRQAEIPEEIAQKTQNVAPSFENCQAGNIIREVFLNFGSYSARDLGVLINKLVEYPGIADENDKIDLEKIKALTEEEWDTIGDNTLITYLRKNLYL